MTLSEKSLDVVNGAVGALKSSPLVLALIILQLLTMGAILYSSMHRQEAISAQFQSLYDLLRLCLGPAPGGG